MDTLQIQEITDELCTALDRLHSWLGVVPCGGKAVGPTPVPQ